MPRVHRFNFKHLDVYQAAVEHFGWSVEAVSGLRLVPFAVISQFLTAPLSIMANVGEANGRAKRSGEAEQRYRYAQGSTYECAAFLDALAVPGAIDDEEYNRREENLARIASMLDRLARKHAKRR